MPRIPSKVPTQIQSILCCVQCGPYGLLYKMAANQSSDQLFVCYGGKSQMTPLLKQRLADWVVGNIAMTYKRAGCPAPTLTCHSMSSDVMFQFPASTRLSLNTFPMSPKVGPFLMTLWHMLLSWPTSRGETELRMNVIVALWILGNYQSFLSVKPSTDLARTWWEVSSERWQYDSSITLPVTLLEDLGMCVHVQKSRFPDHSDHTCRLFGIHGTTVIPDFPVCCLSGNKQYLN